MNRLHSKLYDIVQEARAQDRLQAKRRPTLKRAGKSQNESRQVQDSLSDDYVAVVDYQNCCQDPKLGQSQADGTSNSHTSLSSWTLVRAHFSLLKKPHQNWQEYRQGQRAQEKSEKILRAYDLALSSRQAKSAPDMPPRLEILWFDKPDSGLGLGLGAGQADHANGN